MIHKDICIKFEADGRQYEAVGFLHKDELSVDGNTALFRTVGRIGTAYGYDDEVFLSKHLNNFPDELWKYLLVTKRRYQNCPHFVKSVGEF